MIKSKMCFLSSSCWLPNNDSAESLMPIMCSIPSLDTTTSNAKMSNPPKSSATESNQNLYLSNTSVSSSMADPTHDFQLPETLLRLENDSEQIKGVLETIDRSPVQGSTRHVIVCQRHITEACTHIKAR